MDRRESLPTNIAPSAVTPEVVLIKTEPLAVEPEYVFIKQEPSHSVTPEVTDTLIKQEPTDHHSSVSIEMTPIADTDLSTLIQKPFDEQDFSFDDICEKLQQKVIRPYINKSEFKHRCDICFKRYRLKENLDNHRRAHTGTLLICDICQKGFVRKSLIIRHIRTHTNEKPFKCKTCRKKFTQRCSLIRHQQIHTGTKHMCEICKGTFANSSYLKLHARIHTREKPYSCEVCKKAFPYSGSLKRHRLTQHKIDKAGVKK